MARFKINTNRILKLQDKAIRVINLAQFNESRSPLYKNSKVLKFNDNVALLNFMYVFDSIKGNLPTILNYNFNPILNLHSYKTRCAEQHQMTLPQVKTQIYGLYGYQVSVDSHLEHFG